MFLRNMSIYRLSRKLGIADLNELERVLARRTYRELAPNEFGCDGFVPPMPRYRGTHALIVGRSELQWHSDFDPLEFNNDEPFMFEGFGSPNDALVLAFYREEKAVMAADVKRRLNKRVSEIEEEEGRKVYMKERSELKQSITMKLLPGLQARYWQVPIVIFSNGLVIVGEVGKKAEMALSELRNLLGTFPVVPVGPKDPVPTVLTRLARMQPDDCEHGDEMFNFKVADDFQFQELEEHPAIARMKNTDVTQDEVQGLLNHKVMTHANLSWKDGDITLKLDPKFAIRKMRVSDAAFEAIAGSQEDDEDLAGATYASAMIEHDLVMQMLKDLYQLFGGENMATLGGDEEAKETPLILKNFDFLAQSAEPSDDDADQGEGEP